ncbi:protein phosphatase 2C 77-like [Triticum aestivum]|uniref:protein phosphatase 2C 77-like n=1 Tax=Triticum aestivum TaxID=4565 RepID=UPI001D00307E|nr:protein phosphatase 2C 77-like [Triticum aestivum]
MPTNGEAPAAETAAPAGPASLGWGWGSCPALYVSYGLSALKGRQPELTGALAAVPSFTALSPPMGLDYFGVFDGHSGAAVANYLTEQLHGAIADQILRELVAEAPRFLHGPQGDVEGWWRTAMADAFQTVDAELLKGAGGVDASVAGATALVALVLEEYVVLANCGVSRAVISRGGEILQLTSEHRSNRPDEKQRVENGGGRVDESTNTVDEFLPTSRAFGMYILIGWIGRPFLA